MREALTEKRSPNENENESESEASRTRSRSRDRRIAPAARGSATASLAGFQHQLFIISIKIEKEEKI